MGQTLTNGIYLPDEGERNSYSGLEVNWRTLDALILTVNGKAAPNIANTWTAAQTFTAGITGDLTGNVTGNVTGDLTGTAAKAIADEDGTSIKTGYVNVAGNQTVSGQKTWSGNAFYTAGVYHRNNSYEIGNTPASNVAIPIYFTDKVNVHTGYVRNVILTTGRTQSELYARNKFTNGALSPTGTDVSSTLQVEVQSNGDKTLYWDGSIRNNVLPYTTNTYSLGSSSYQWSSVYAQTYYYNGTEFSNKFVTIDTTQTISGLKYFSSSVLHKTPQTIDVSTNLAEDITGKGLEFVDNTRYWGDIAPQWITDGTFRIRIAMTNYNTSGTSTGWCCPIVLDFAKDGSKVDIWSTHPNSNLGTSTNKWKTLNGINPGALSLPSTTYTNVDTTNWLLDGTFFNYAPTLDGYLEININPNSSNVSRVAVECTFFRQSSESSIGNTSSLTVPVVKGSTYGISLIGSSIAQARFMAMQGNV